MNQNLNLYHIFYEVAKCGNISSASKELYISQPAVSKAVSKLEQNLNTLLFIRSSKGVKLTPEGNMLYAQISEAFRYISFGEEQLHKMTELGVGHLSIGVSTTLCKYVLLPYLQSFIHKNPHIKISISCQSTYQTLQALQEGTIDLGLVGEPEAHFSFVFYPIAEIEDIFVTTKNYMDNLRTRLSGGTLTDIMDNATFLMLDKENLTRQYIDRYLGPGNFNMKQIIEVSTMDLLIEFAKIELGIACVIRNFVEKELDNASLICFPIPYQIPKRKIGFVCYNSANPTLQKFIDHFEICAP